MTESTSSSALPSGPPAGAPLLAASEAELVALVRALVRGQRAEVRARIGNERRALPPKISTACAHMLRDALEKVWPALWRRGGIAPLATLSRGEVRKGRVWERHAPSGLVFSGQTLCFLRWMQSNPLGWTNPPSNPLPAAVLTPGDQVVLYLALDATLGTTAHTTIAQQSFTRASPLAWLGFADSLAAAQPHSPRPTIDFAELCGGVGAIVVEALALELARRWRAGEHAKRRITSPDALLALGAAQDATLGGFMAACNAAQRRDLAAFIVDAAAPLLSRGLAPIPAQLDPRTPLSARSAARLAAGALLRAVQAWSDWDRAHRGVRFIDDDYAAAQLLLARYDAIGAAGAARAQQWLADLTALAPPGSEPAATVDTP